MSTQRVETAWETDPSLGHVTFTNHEAVPSTADTQAAFRDKVIAACASGRLPAEADGPWREAKGFFAARVYQG